MSRKRRLDDRAGRRETAAILRVHLHGMPLFVGYVSGSAASIFSPHFVGRILLFNDMVNSSQIYCVRAHQRRAAAVGAVAVAAAAAATESETKAQSGEENGSFIAFACLSG